MYSENKYNINSLYWELSGNNNLIEDEKAAIDELVKLDLKNIILDITFLKSDDILKIALENFTYHYNPECKISIKVNRKGIHLLLKLLSGSYAKDIKKIIIVLSDDNIDEFVLLISKAKELGIIIELNFQVDSNNYKYIDDSLLEFYKYEPTLFSIQIRRFGNNTLKAEDLLEFIRKFTDVSRYFRVNINVISFDNIIQNICEKSILDKIYIDKDGYIATSEILPTFFENIKERNIIQCWNRYIFLYLNQCLLIYIRSFGLDSKFRTKEDIRRECLQKGFFNSNIPYLAEQWEFIQDKNGLSLIRNTADESIININGTGVEILKNMNGSNSIYDIMKKIKTEYPDVPRSKIYYDVMQYINSLEKNKAILYKDNMRC